MSDRLSGCLVPRLARASARKRAYTADETNERDKHPECRTARRRAP